VRETRSAQPRSSRWSVKHHKCRDLSGDAALTLSSQLCSFISSAILPGLAQQADELEARTDEALLVECRHFALHNSRLRRAGALLAQLMLVDGKS
jgi:hypothetical protein